MINPRAVATLGIGFGQAQVAAIGLLPAFIRPIVRVLARARAGMNEVRVVMTNTTYRVTSRTRKR